MGDPNLREVHLDRRLRRWTTTLGIATTFVGALLGVVIAVQSGWQKIFPKAAPIAAIVHITSPKPKLADQMDFQIFFDFQKWNLTDEAAAVVDAASRYALANHQKIIIDCLADDPQRLVDSGQTPIPPSILEAKRKHAIRAELAVNNVPLDLITPGWGNTNTSFDDQGVRNVLGRGCRMASVNPS